MKETMESLRQKLAEASQENQSLLTELKQTKERLAHSDNEQYEMRKQQAQISSWLSAIGIPSVIRTSQGSYPIYLDIISRLMLLATKIHLPKEEKCQDQS